MPLGIGLKPVTKWMSLLMGALLSSHTVFAEEEHWVQRINMSGFMEANYSSSEDFSGKKTSDITVAKVGVNLDAKVNDKVSAHVALLHEEDATDFSVDAAYIDVDLGVVNTQVGAMGAPFGSFTTNMLADPLTMQLAETAETMLQVGTEFGTVQASVYVFNGTTQEAAGDDVADQMGVHLAYVAEGKGSSMDIGVDYINNIADSDTIGDYLENDASGPQSNVVKAYVPAQIFHANLSFGHFHFIAEHLVADKFEATEIAFKGKGAEISATNLEVAYDLSIAGVDSTFAVGVQSTEEAVALGMPKEKTLLAMSFGVYKFTALSFEYANSTDYDTADGGTGKDATSYTLQLAIGF